MAITRGTVDIPDAPTGRLLLDTGEWVAPEEVVPGGGQSAYEIAVDNGFVGTEVEWLASLVGAPGLDGADGQDGDVGPIGQQGPQGIPGDQGEVGPQGSTGADGDDGIQGLQGIQGIQGVPGNDGAPGQDGAPGDVSAAWPVGSVFISVVATNPATLLGFGTWLAIGAGKMLVGFDSGDTDFDTLEETGGAKTVTITEAQIPAHTHTQAAHNHAVTDPGHTHLTQRYPTATGASSGFTIDTSMSGTLADNTLPTKINTTGLTVNNQTATNNNTGGGAAHNNLPPFFVVNLWKRTA